VKLPTVGSFISSDCGILQILPEWSTLSEDSGCVTNSVPLCTGRHFYDVAQQLEDEDEE